MSFTLLFPYTHRAFSTYIRNHTIEHIMKLKVLSHFFVAPHLYADCAIGLVIVKNVKSWAMVAAL